MSTRRPSFRRLLLPSLLAVTLAAESIAIVSAVDVPRLVDGPSSYRDDVPTVVTPTPTLAAPDPGPDGLVRPAALAAPHPAQVTQPPAPEPAPTPKPKPAKPKPAKPKPAESKPKQTASKPKYQGRNHMWMPALGINRSVSFFKCTSNAYPGDKVYRWGCAGRNNVYLFGHAHSVFKPLHDAYVRGRLKKGMKVYYADNDGRVRAYKIAWWKVTTPDKGAWAYAGQSRPSLTLQTCVGARSEYRLVVRLVRA